jgi:hypothetical protein
MVTQTTVSSFATFQSHFTIRFVLKMKTWKRAWNFQIQAKKLIEPTSYDFICTQMLNSLTGLVLLYEDSCIVVAVNGTVIAFLLTFFSDIRI